MYGFAAVVWGGCVTAAFLSTFENDVTAKEESLFRHYGLRRWTPITHYEGSSWAICLMNFCHDVILARVVSAAFAFESD